MAIGGKEDEPKVDLSRRGAPQWTSADGQREFNPPPSPPRPVLNLSGLGAVPMCAMKTSRDLVNWDERLASVACLPSTHPAWFTNITVRPRQRGPHLDTDMRIW
jgi:hypothetical protein